MLASMTRSQRSQAGRHPALAIAAITAALSSIHCGNTSASDLALCHAPASVGGAPQTIEDVTHLINALIEERGGTVDLPCFVSSLDRPLGAEASSGFVSAQPAEGARSPRMFFWSGPLVLSVVPEGIGLNLLELGFQTEPTRSIKAEILFPVREPLSLSAPYDRILDKTETKCVGCHSGEKPATSVTWAPAFESDVLRLSDSDVVDLGYVDLQSKLCDAKMEAQRCAVLRSIFDQGGIHAQSFAREAKTIYGD